MPVNQPPITQEDPVRSSWDLEVATLVNRLEQLVQQLETDVTALEDAPAPVPAPAGFTIVNDMDVEPDDPIVDLRSGGFFLATAPAGTPLTIDFPAGTLYDLTAGDFAAGTEIAVAAGGNSALVLNVSPNPVTLTNGRPVMVTLSYRFT